jgi:hypothetical protein
MTVLKNPGLIGTFTFDTPIYASSGPNYSPVAVLSTAILQRARRRGAAFLAGPTEFIETDWSGAGRWPGRDQAATCP